MAGQQTRRILIKVVGDGLGEVAKLAKSMGLLTKQTADMSRSMATLSSTMQGFLGYLGIREITRMADSMQQLRDRVSLFTSSATQTESVLQGIADVANRTRSSIEDTTAIYTRMAASTKDLGLSQQAVLQVTETLANTFRLSGASASEATGAAIQLSQAFAKGRLDGDELKSIMEQNVVLTDLLAKGFKVTRGELKQMGSDGKLLAGQSLKVILDASKDVNAQAEKLSATFGQSLTKATNQLAISIGKLNEKYEVAKKFADLIPLLASNLDLLAGAIIGVSTVLAGSKLFTFITALANLSPQVRLVTLLATAMAALGSAVAYFTRETDENRVSIVSQEDVKRAADLQAELLKTATIMKWASGITSGIGVDITKSAEGIGDIAGTYKLLKTPIQSPLKPGDNTDQSKRLAEIDEEARRKKRLAEEAVNPMLALNRAYLDGTISAEKYFNSLDAAKLKEVQLDFAKGKKTLADLNSEMRKADEANLNKQLKSGAISLELFNMKLKEIRLAELNQDLLTGTITLEKFNKEVAKLKTVSADAGFWAQFFDGFKNGVNDWVSGVESMSVAMSKTWVSALDSLSGELVEFVKTGKRDFSDWAQTVLDEMSKIIIKTQILLPLMRAVSSAFSSTPVTSIPASPDSGFTDYIVPYANGGVVNSPTFFSSQGKMSVAGEAGPEAILPLKRGADGKLGVASGGGSGSNVYVNVINNSGSSVETKETTGSDGTRTIEVIVTGVVKNAIANGSLDRAMQSSYGLNRRGS